LQDSKLLPLELDHGAVPAQFVMSRIELKLTEADCARHVTGEAMGTALVTDCMLRHFEWRQMDLLTMI
jgi:hypothetical protein